MRWSSVPPVRSVCWRHCWSTPTSVVATGHTVDRIWGEQQPRRARQLVSNYLSRPAGLDTPWTAAVREGLAWKRFAADSHRLYLALRLGRHEAALPAALFHRHRDLEGEVATHNSLGWIEHSVGNHRQSVQHYQRAATPLRAVGNRPPLPLLRRPRSARRGLRGLARSREAVPAARTRRRTRSTTAR